MTNKYLEKIAADIEFVNRGRVRKADTAKTVASHTAAGAAIGAVASGAELAVRKGGMNWFADGALGTFFKNHPGTVHNKVKGWGRAGLALGATAGAFRAIGRSDVKNSK